MLYRYHLASLHFFLLGEPPSHALLSHSLAIPAHYSLASLPPLVPGMNTTVFCQSGLDAVVRTGVGRDMSVCPQGDVFSRGM